MAISYPLAFVCAHLIATKVISEKTEISPLIPDHYVKCMIQNALLVLANDVVVRIRITIVE
jgi:hypothetical protein